ISSRRPLMSPTESETGCLAIPVFTGAPTRGGNRSPIKSRAKAGVHLGRGIPAFEYVKELKLSWTSGGAPYETAAPRPPQDEVLSQCHQRHTSCRGAPEGASRSTHDVDAAHCFTRSFAGMTENIILCAPCGWHARVFPKLLEAPPWARPSVPTRHC